jgi:P4 family phage/plasmid primase-like protien
MNKVGADDPIVQGADITDFPRVEVPVLPTFTDVGNAQRFVAAHGQVARYCYAHRCWFLYDGSRWQRDPGDGIMRLAKDTAAGLYRDAAGLATRELRKQVADWAAKTESEPRLRAMLSLAQSELAIRPEQFDADRWALNCMNGTLDLQAEAVLHPHRRAQLITRIVPTIYDPSAECPIWESVLATLFQGDEGLIQFVQKGVGYSLTGDTREQVVFIFHGSGANGKTLVLMVLMDLLGEYATQTPASTLLVKKGDGIPNDIARLAGCRFAAAVETEDGQRLAEGLVKQMTGRDRLVARFLRAEFFEFVPQFKLFLATNHKPRIRGTDHAIWRRIRLVPFAVTIPDAQQDRDLPEKLKAECRASSPGRSGAVSPGSARAWAPRMPWRNGRNVIARRWTCWGHSSPSVAASNRPLGAGPAPSMRPTPRGVSARANGLCPSGVSACASVSGASRPRRSTATGGGSASRSQARAHRRDGRIRRKFRHYRY